MSAIAGELSGLRSHRAAQAKSFALLFVLCLPALVPLAAVLTAMLTPETEIWAHLARHVLPGVLGNTLVLVVGVSLATAVLGTGLAWLTATCDFPARRFFEWALLLPLAVPSYVLAFIA